MVCGLSKQCDVVFECLKYALREGTIDVDLKVCTLKGIHTFQKDYTMQMIKCSP